MGSSYALPVRLSVTVSEWRFPAAVFSAAVSEAVFTGSMIHSSQRAMGVRGGPRHLLLVRHFIPQLARGALESCMRQRGARAGQRTQGRASFFAANEVQAQTVHIKINNGRGVESEDLAGEEPGHTAE